MLSWLKEEKRFYIPVWLEDSPEPIIALLNTGADYNVLNSKFISHLHSTESEAINARTTDNTLMKNFLCMKKKLKIRTEDYEGNSNLSLTEFIVSPDTSYPLMPGYPGVRKYNQNWIG
jgi:hypothetical protein